MKTLFLDDDIERHLQFRRRFPEAVQVAYPVHAKIELRDSGPWDEVWLDHDLSYIFDPASPQPHREPTFVHDVMPLVDWVCENKPAVGKFVVHSWNGPAASRMAAKLRDAGYTVTVSPFSVSA